MFSDIEPGQIEDLPPLAHSRRNQCKVLSALLAVGGPMLDDGIGGGDHQQRFTRMTRLSALFFSFVVEKDGFDLIGFLVRPSEAGGLWELVEF